MPAQKPKLRHHTKIAEGKDGEFVNLFGGQHRFECSCGEKGDWRSREDFARRDADRHRAENV